MLRPHFMLTLILLIAPPALGQVNLVVSITPLRLIAEGILDGHGNTRVLVPVSGSPHHYTMTPSDRLALASADLILYVGEQLETELHGVMRNLARNQQVVELSTLPGLFRRQLEGSGTLDPHIWLDDRNGLVIAAALRDILSERFPDRASTWQENYWRLEQQLLADEVRWRDELDSVPGQSYAVYHDAIGYFESRFARSHSIVLLENPELQPGIRQIMQIRKAITELRPVCLFTDVTSRQNTVDTLFDDTPVRQVQLDLLGDRLEAGAGYPQLLDNLVTDFSDCLRGDDI
ncbi:MAG: zinc ABC transporter substrate-binding protein [Gammaproteobacteria bacterium]|nr:zinc ABC transporter substrate-binding protein [Pseudomonadales bacterium]